MIKALTCKKEPCLPSIKEGFAFRIYKSEMETIIGDAAYKMFDYLSVKAYDKDFKKVEFEDFKILLSKPFVDFGDYVYMPLLFSTLMNIPKQFHYSFIAEKIFDNKIVGIYTGNRGDVVEELTAIYLARLIDKNKIYCSLSYLGEDGEADVTTICHYFSPLLVVVLSSYVFMCRKCSGGFLRKLFCIHLFQDLLKGIIPT